MLLKAVDCLTPLTKEIAPKFKKSIDAVFRYLRNLTKAEVDAIHGAGLGLLLLWETNPTHASYFTYARGVEDATNAARWAQVLGAPESTALVHTVDYDAAAGDMAAIDAYVEGITSVIGDRAGLYGDYRVMEHVKTSESVKWLFQTYGWSYGSKVDGVQAYQHTNAVTLAGIGVDLDDLYTRDGLWWPDTPRTQSGQAHPVQGGDNVQVPELKEGVKGHEEAIRAVQGAAGTTIDGQFGPLTKDAVERFQREHGLSIDGIVGPQTWSKMLA